MRTRRLAMMLAVVAMVMGAMAPASAAKGGVNSTDLADKGWNCDLDNFVVGDVTQGAGVHCAKVDILGFLGGGTGTLHVMVFSSPADDRYPEEAFLGTELLRFDKKKDLIAKHAWHGGFDPTAP